MLRQLADHHAAVWRGLSCIQAGLCHGYTSFATHLNTTTMTGSCVPNEGPAAQGCLLLKQEDSSAYGLELQKQQQQQRQPKNNRQQHLTFLPGLPCQDVLHSSSQHHGNLRHVQLQQQQQQQHLSSAIATWPVTAAAAAATAGASLQRRLCTSSSKGTHRTAEWRPWGVGPLPCLQQCRHTQPMLQQTCSSIWVTHRQQQQQQQRQCTPQHHPPLVRWSHTGRPDTHHSNSQRAAADTSSPAAPTSPSSKPKLRRNNQITAPRLLVVLPDGTKRVMHTAEAVGVADQLGLDLVEVNARSEPPVARILDYGKMMYEQQQKSDAVDKQRRLQQKLATPKEMQFSARIADHDLEVKMKKVAGWLEQGYRVQLVVKYRREEQEAAADALAYLSTRIQADFQVEVGPQQPQRKALSVLIKPLAVPAHAHK